MSSSVADPLTASVLRPSADRYDLLETIAEGPTATVYKALDKELDEVIALKVLAEAVAANKRFVDQLKDEIRTSRRVRHPNVARVYDLERLDDRLCISMEFIEGRTLAKRLAEAPMHWSEAVSILRTIALALQSAHEIGVVHRDLKPANLMVDAADRPYLLDFGIALGPTNARVNDGDIVRGTPGYMAPERWKGVPGLPASDMYSLGIVAYEMLCGRPPFRSGSLRVLMSQHLHSPPPPLGEQIAGIPPDLDNLIRGLLEKQPERRPQPAAMARSLRALAPRTPQAEEDAERGTILVVEDESPIRRLLGELLRRRGARVLLAKDGEEGLRLARESSPDLIILDVGMPGRSGVDILRELKDDPATAGKPVVMLSGSSDPEHPTVTRGLGAAAFLNKPVNTDVLDLVLEKYL